MLTRGWSVDFQDVFKVRMDAQGSFLRVGNSALPGAGLLPAVSTCVTVRGSWSLRIDVPQGDSPLTNGSITAVASNTSTLGIEQLSGILFSLRKEGHWFSRIWALAAVTPVFSGSPRCVPFTSRNVVSSVAVSGVIKVFNDLKVSKSSSPEDVKKRKKAVLFCLSEDTNLILEEGEEMLVGDVGQTADDPYAILVKVLPHKDCHYALCDAACETKESKEEAWAPESAPLKSKMIYASSKDAVEEKLTGIKHELEANCYEEVKDHCTLAEKLGASVFISLEGKPQTCPPGLQAAPFLPDQRGWGGGPSRGRAIPSLQLPNNLPTSWTILLPPSLKVLAFPNCFFFFFFGTRA
uniref:Uncharacterized protein LOC101318932 n=2 Tax=Tursiops truncatus TaxID=9739 RepID=A0A6J3PUV7_TURTR